MVPDKTNVPDPALVRPKVPAPSVIAPPYVSVLPEATSILLLAPNVMPRFVLRVTSFVVKANVPPFRLIEAAVTDPGVLPKLLSARIDKVPAEIVVVPS